MQATSEAFRKMMFSDEFQEVAQAASRAVFSGSTISRSQVHLDSAFALYYRDVWQEMCSKQGPIYVFTDSSPQLGTDWLMSICDYVSADSLLQAFHCALTLARSQDLFLQAEKEQATDKLADVAKSRAEASAFLAANIIRHRQQPVGLGAGRTALEDKCRGLAHKFLNESHSLSHLRSVLAQICSFTTDMGTEGGLADACGGPVDNYLPSWIFGGGRPLEPDEFCWEDSVVVNSSAGVGADHMFARSLMVAGLDHISDNLQSELDNHLPSFKGWLPGFKALAHLLSHKHLLNRVIGCCILGGPFQDTLAPIFETAVVSVAKWRWGTIVLALPEIIAKQRALSVVWNEQKFMEGGRKDGQDSQQDDQLDCKTITATLKDPLWWVYAKMLLALHETGNFSQLGAVAAAATSGCLAKPIRIGRSWRTHGQNEAYVAPVMALLVHARCEAGERLSWPTGCCFLA